MQLPAKKPAKRITILLHPEVDDLLSTYNSYLPEDCNLNLTQRVNELLRADLKAKLDQMDSQ